MLPIGCWLLGLDHANDFVKITRENRFAMMNVLACVDINHVEGFENYHQACRVEDVEVVDYKLLDEVIEKYRINSSYAGNSGFI